MRFLVAVLVAGLTSTAAYAADAVIQEPAPIDEAPIFTWTGGYIGIQGGYVWSDTHAGFPDGSSFSDSFDGGMFGGFAGYNWQSGPYVFGVEGDFNGVWNDKTFNIGGLDVEIGSDYLASIRGRVGYAFDRALIFATGGVAFTQVSAQADLFNGVRLDSDQSYTGWTIGAGAEYAFTNNWIGRLEYRYYDFNNKSIDGFGDVDVEDNTVTVGLSYKF